MKHRWHRFTHHVGANPLQALVLIGSLALIGYVIAQMGPSNLWNQKVWWQSILVWFLGAVVLHDLILFPLYLISDHSAAAAWRALHSRRSSPPLVHPVNYLRLPIMGSGLLFLLFFPGIIEQGSGAYHRATGQTQAPYFDRWLLLTAAMFLVSAIVYAIRTAIARRSRLTDKVTSSPSTPPEEPPG